MFRLCLVNISGRLGSSAELWSLCKASIVPITALQKNQSINQWVKSCILQHTQDRNR